MEISFRSFSSSLQSRNSHKDKHHLLLLCMQVIQFKLLQYAKFPSHILQIIEVADDGYLCFRLTANIQLLQSEREMPNYSLAEKPRQAMASWLKNFIKFTKLFLDSYSRLIHLHTTKKSPHDLSSKIHVS